MKKILYAIFAYTIFNYTAFAENNKIDPGIEEPHSHLHLIESIEDNIDQTLELNETTAEQASLIILDFAKVLSLRESGNMNPLDIVTELSLKVSEFGLTKIILMPALKMIDGYLEDENLKAASALNHIVFDLNPQIAISLNEAFHLRPQDLKESFGNIGNALDMGVDRRKIQSFLSINAGKDKKDIQGNFQNEVLKRKRSLSEETLGIGGRSDKMKMKKGFFSGEESLGSFSRHPLKRDRTLSNLPNDGHNSSHFFDLGPAKTNPFVRPGFTDFAHWDTQKGVHGLNGPKNNKGDYPSQSAGVNSLKDNNSFVNYGGNIFGGKKKLTSPGFTKGPEGTPSKGGPIFGNDRYQNSRLKDDDYNCLKGCAGGAVGGILGGIRGGVPGVILGAVSGGIGGCIGSCGNKDDETPSAPEGNPSNDPMTGPETNPSSPSVDTPSSPSMPKSNPENPIYPEPVEPRSGGDNDGGDSNNGSTPVKDKPRTSPSDNDPEGNPRGNDPQEAPDRPQTPTGPKRPKEPVPSEMPKSPKSPKAPKGPGTPERPEGPRESKDPKSPKSPEKPDEPKESDGPEDSKDPKGPKDTDPSDGPRPSEESGGNEAKIGLSILDVTRERPNFSKLPNHFIFRAPFDGLKDLKKMPRIINLENNL